MVLHISKFIFFNNIYNASLSYIKCVILLQLNADAMEIGKVFLTTIPIIYNATMLLLV